MNTPALTFIGLSAHCKTCILGYLLVYLACLGHDTIKLYVRFLKLHKWVKFTTNKKDCSTLMTEPVMAEIHVWISSLTLQDSTLKIMWV